MIRTQKEKESFSFKYQFKQCRSKNWSENDRKAVKWSVRLHNEEKYAWKSTQQKNEYGS